MTKTDTDKTPLHNRGSLDKMLNYRHRFKGIKRAKKEYGLKEKVNDFKQAIIQV